MALDQTLSSTDRVNLVIAGKHPLGVRLADMSDEEAERGLAIWPDLSDDTEPDLTVVAAGDLPARVAVDAAEGLRTRLRCRIRVVGLLELTVLGDPGRW